MRRLLPWRLLFCLATSAASVLIFLYARLILVAQPLRPIWSYAATDPPPPAHKEARQKEVRRRNRHHRGHRHVDRRSYRPEDDVTSIRREAVVEAFAHSWRGYERHAWGHDELQPLSNRSNEAWGGLAVTMVDGLDTAYLLGLSEEFDRAVSYIEHSLVVNVDHKVSVFEITIRVLGGLLGAYDLSGDERLLRKARELGERLLGAFEGGSEPGLPCAQLNLRTSECVPKHPWAPGVILAEVGSVQLELSRLLALTPAQAAEPKGSARSQATRLQGTGLQGTAWGSSEARRRLALAAGSMQVILSNYASASDSGLYPHYLGYRSALTLTRKSTHMGTSSSSSSAASSSWLSGLLGVPSRLLGRGTPASSSFHINGGCDSFYEYLLKMWLLGGQRDESIIRAYQDAVGGVRKRLLRRVANHTFVGSWDSASGILKTRMEHLACFAPGMLALGALAAPARLATDASLAIELGETCWMLYERSPSGLAADAVAFDESLEPDGFRPLAEEYPLRPETVESFVYLWRLTRDSVWRERGWRIFEALQVRCRTNSGFASLKGHLREDSMPSYWLAETLKYLFLLFSDDAVLPLDQFVLNTEAHPLRIR
jgi:hypothetical protein